MKSWSRWELVGSGGLGEAPGWMGSSPGEAWAEGTLSGLLPPDTSLLAWDFFGGRCSAGAVLDSPVLWLLDTTGTAPPGLGGHFRVRRAHEGLAAGVKAYHAPPGPGAYGDAPGRAPPVSRLSARAKNLWGCPGDGGAGPEGRGLRGHTA